MANILFRSPYFVTITTGGHLSAQLALTIDGTLRYTILNSKKYLCKRYKTKYVFY